MPTSRPAPFVDAFNQHLKLSIADGGRTQMWHRLSDVLEPWYEQLADKMRFQLRMTRDGRYKPEKVLSAPLDVRRPPDAPLDVTAILYFDSPQASQCRPDFVRIHLAKRLREPASEVRRLLTTERVV